MSGPSQRGDRRRDALGDQLLAGSALANDQHRAYKFRGAAGLLATASRKAIDWPTKCVSFFHG